MQVKFGQTRFGDQGGGLNFAGSLNVSDTEVENLDDALSRKPARKIDEDSDAVVTAADESGGVPLQLSVGAGLIETAGSAADALVDLRSTQLDLATEATGLAYGSERLTALNTESQTIDSEIARIAEEATYNGQNALDGQLLTATFTSADYNDAAGLADITSLTTDLSLSLATPSAATTAYTTLKASVSSAYQLSGAVSATGAKLDDVIERSQALVPSEDFIDRQLNDIANRAADEESRSIVPADLANKLRSELLSAKSADSSSLTETLLANDLDSIKVRSLLSED